MPHRPCLQPLCPEAALEGSGYCLEHRRDTERRASRFGRALYRSWKWQNTRKRYLLENPLCECGCGQIATDVHHRVDLRDGGSPWDFGGLEALAHDCHSRETRRRTLGR